MIDIGAIEKLAKLSRLDLSEAEKAKFQKDIGSILAYVDQIQQISAGDIEPQAGMLRNVMREDHRPIEAGTHTTDIVNEFPRKEGNYLKVKKILS